MTVASHQRFPDAPRWHCVPVFLALLVLAACSDPQSPATPSLQIASLNSGDGQADKVLATLPNPLRVLVLSDGAPAPTDTVLAIRSIPLTVVALDHYGNAAPGAAVGWNVPADQGSVSALAEVSDASGRASATEGCFVPARTRHTLGAIEGLQSVTATANGFPDAPSVAFTATAVTALVSVGTYRDYDYYDEFAPTEVTVPTGTTVGWGWYDNYHPHNVTFEDDPTQSSPIQSEGTHQRRFDAPGTYRYRSKLHSTSFTEGMVGLVIVQ